MGAHKHNPTAIAAKNGELPPKPKKKSKREVERKLYAKCAEIMCKSLAKTFVGMQKEGAD